MATVNGSEDQAIGETRATTKESRPPGLRASELSLGHNARLGRRVVEQACVKHLHQARRLPDDSIDFMNRARVHFLDVDGHEIEEVDSVMITWED